MKKLCAFLLAASMLTGVLAGCNRSSDNTDPAPAGEESAQAPAGDDSAGAADGEDVSISLWTIVPTQSHMDVLMPVWEETYPNIQIDYLTFGDSDEYYKKMQIAMASDEGPDVFTVNDRPRVEQFSEYMVPVAPLAEAELGADWENRFLPLPLEAAFSYTQDGYHAMPLNVEAEMYVLYNKTQMEELGVTNFEPDNYADFKAMCDDIKAQGTIPVVFGGKNKTLTCDMFLYVANQYEPGFPERVQAGEASWTDQAGVDALNATVQIFQEILQDGVIGLEQYPDARDQYYYSRQTPMFITGLWHVGYVMPGGEKYGTSIENDETGYFLLPQIGPNEAKPTIGAGQALGINKLSENMDAAETFFKWLTMGEGCEVFTNLVQGGPARNDVEFNRLDTIESDFVREEVVEIMGGLNNSYGIMRLDHVEVTDAIAVAVHEVYSGKETAKALEEVQQIFESVR